MKFQVPVSPLLVYQSCEDESGDKSCEDESGDRSCEDESCEFSYTSIIKEKYERLMHC